VRVLAQDPLVQLAQLDARLNADLIDEPPPRHHKGIERLGLTARPVQRKHPLGTQALAQRVLLDQPLQLAQRLLLAPRRELGVHRQLGRAQPQLVKPADLDPGERLVRDVGQRRTAPQRERLARQTVGGVAGGLLDETLEARDVNGVRGDPQLVAAPTGQDLGPVACQQATQLRHVQLHHLRSRRRRGVAPETTHEAVDRDRSVRLQGEHGQHRSLLGGTQRDRPVVDGRLDRPEQPHVHR
jgi:hypothetical protein